MTRNVARMSGESGETEDTYLEENEIRKFGKDYVLLKHGKSWGIHYDYKGDIIADRLVNREREKGKPITLYEIWKICTDLKDSIFHNVIQ